MRGEEQQSLDRLKTMFSKHRSERRSQQPRYPKELKLEAISIISTGVPFSRVARAVGVSDRSLRNWTEELGSERIEGRARQLVVVDGRDVQASNISNSESGLGVQIHFKSGVRIELPSSSLTAELISWLNGVGRC